MEEITLILCNNCQAHHFPDEVKNAHAECTECGELILGERKLKWEQEQAFDIVAEMFRRLF